jgi:holin (3TMs family)
LFTFAMADPVAFGIRMQGLGLVPDPLWWLLGAIVSFYFGARELHHFRGGGARVSPGAVADVVTNIETLRDSLGPTATTTPQPVGTASVPQVAPGIGAELTALARDNAALREWLDGRR